ncbi:saccharopine dehydrogenase family protein [Metaclostridioides mangenotii]|uniref:saccharopine dehydrogenase family protein n=1 Tax=Metaclostridioides mangenotii TaxID=1540 RepID=UPI0004877D20|nr:saccharopine dehydrogenase NADP-binding domain-containing protein [Clostridioides mangenotii]
MKLVVLGGAGSQALYGIKDLINHSSIFDEVIISSRNLEKNKKIVENLNSPIVKAAEVDVSDEEALYELIKNCDVVANCTGPYHIFAYKIIETTIKAGKHYIDFCDDIEAFNQIFESDLPKKAEEKGLSMIMGLGASPGFLSVLACSAEQRYFDSVNEAIFYFACDEKEPGGPAVLGHMLECVHNAPYIKNGVKLNEPSFREEWDFDFGKPYGIRKVTRIGHPEVFTFPRYSSGIQNVSVRFSLEPASAYEGFKELSLAGLTSNYPLNINGNPVSPRDFALAVLLKQKSNQPVMTEEELNEFLKGVTACAATELHGKKDGKNISYIGRVAGNMAPLTAIPLIIGAEMLGKGEITKKGIMVAEEAIENADKFVKETVNRIRKDGFGFTVSEELTVKEVY